MAPKPPFEFDLRVSADKKRKQASRRGATAPEPTGRGCDHPGCDRSAAYRAPKSPDLLDEFFWFCKDHIRDYNLKWNFFQGSTDDEFQKFIDKDRVWGREIYVDSRTVDVHIGRLRKALTVHGGEDPLRTVRGAGYSLG